MVPLAGMTEIRGRTAVIMRCGTVEMTTSLEDQRMAGEGECRNPGERRARVPCARMLEQGIGNLQGESIAGGKGQTCAWRILWRGVS